ncbi:hypothetical protein BBK14_32670 [Parafrankia soli]|uniref:Uncharacterized protein n=1 Tax=Parafrankia soli TaxID=2599596 RepID=A0A1S1R1Z3_9ACTN|nr:hypothetical protein BBK14_32670 [Parafrankia soli]
MYRHLAAHMDGRDCILVVYRTPAPAGSVAQVRSDCLDVWPVMIGACVEVYRPSRRSFSFAI